MSKRDHRAAWGSTNYRVVTTGKKKRNSSELNSIVTALRTIIPTIVPRIAGELYGRSLKLSTKKVLWREARGLWYNPDRNGENH